MTFDEVLKGVLDACPGARAGAIVDRDGIPLVVEPDRPELEALCAEMAGLIRDLSQAGRELDHGTLKQLSTVNENAQIVLTTMAAGYFLVVEMEPGAVAGRARLAGRLAGERLFSEFL